MLVKKLHSHGHELSVIRPTDSWFIQENSPYYTSITVTLKKKYIGLDLFESAVQRILEVRRESPVMGVLAQISEFIGIIKVAHTANCAMLTTMLENKDLIKQIKIANYDLMLTDPAMPGGVILAHYFQLPMVYNVRWMSFGEGHFSIAPSPISYVPVPGSGLTDRMGLLERTRNLLHYGLNLIQERLLVIPMYSSLLLKYFPPGADLLTMQQSAELWLVRVDFVFEFPRPSMPNLVYIGGFQCRPAKPLPAELEKFMQSSGDHGVVVMSLGTLITGLPERSWRPLPQLSPACRRRLYGGLLVRDLHHWAITPYYCNGYLRMTCWAIRIPVLSWLMGAPMVYTKLSIMGCQYWDSLCYLTS